MKNNYVFPENTAIKQYIVMFSFVYESINNIKQVNKKNRVRINQNKF